MGVLSPPRLLFSWTASNFGSAWGGYKVKARETRAVAGDWFDLFDIKPVPGRANSVVEAQHTKVLTSRLGWHNSGVSPKGRFSDGHDLAVSALNTTTGKWTELEDADVTAQVVTGDSHPWICSDARPYLDQPLVRTSPARGKHPARRSDSEVVGRGLSTARVRVELPSREYDVNVRYYDPVGEDQLRYLRAAASVGEQVVLHLPLGDRICGVLDAPSSFDHTGDLFLETEFNIIETGRPPFVPLVPAEINVPCGVVLDGTADYVSVADANTLDPDSSAFTVIVCCVPAGVGSSKWMLTKGNVGSAAGYGIGTTGSANQVKFVVQGASATATLTATDTNLSNAAWLADPRGHVFAGTSTGTAQKLYVDGTDTAASGSATHGAVTNAVALVLGALNGGGSGFMAANPMIAAAYYPRALSDSEVLAASYYLRGIPGYRMPAASGTGVDDGPALLLDLRDQRCWNGTGTIVKDLSGKRNHGTLVSSPPTRGLVWDLALLEKFG